MASGFRTSRCRDLVRVAIVAMIDGLAENETTGCCGNGRASPNELDGGSQDELEIKRLEHIYIYIYTIYVHLRHRQSQSYYDIGMFEKAEGPSHDVSVIGGGRA